ncbi:Zn-ribbon domain-containing OB-fold protein [uncultured Enterovirga sp.]|uniref:Zn-ribbon domain-containing OB-fold protein n=1 Tax=uncultured Enterovirga sp. TaxID=2026352 RepID=UPI0035CA5D82
MTLPGDWTTGEPAITYQSCQPCGHRWYFRRGFCPCCGATDPDTLTASGRGTVYAATIVNRAPSEALRALAPYGILMVDAEEGFHLMAHGAPGLAIGDPVAARFEPFGPLLIPVFDRQST